MNFFQKLGAWVKGIFAPAKKVEGDELDKLVVNLITGTTTAVSLWNDDKSFKGDTLALIKAASPLISNVKNAKKVIEELKDFNSERALRLMKNLIAQGVMPDKVDIIMSHGISAIERSYFVYVNHIRPIYDEDIVPIIAQFKK